MQIAYRLSMAAAVERGMLQRCGRILAQDAIIEFVEPNQRYDEMYQHWRGTPPKIVDIHPNSLAHSIIAGEIAAAIQDCR